MVNRFGLILIGTVLMLGGFLAYSNTVNAISPDFTFTNVNPNEGPIAGGQEITLTGANFIKQFESISAGDYHNCGIYGGDVYCWGGGYMGDGGESDYHYLPVAIDTSGVLSGLSITALADPNGADDSCVIASDGSAYCWGYNYQGQLGNNSITTSSVPVAVDASGVLSGKTVTAIAVGWDHACAIANGDAYCWGNNDRGQLGDGTTTSSLVPVAVDTSGILNGKTITAISTNGSWMGTSYTCVVASDNGVYCWGGNQYGQLGDGSTDSSSVPVAVDMTNVSGGKFVDISTSGYGHACAVTEHGNAYCWGSNNFSQLGDGSTTDSSIPVAVDTSGVLNGKTITAVSTGGRYTCVTDSDGNVYCWGENGNGQLGDGSIENSLIPVAVDMSGALSGLSIKEITTGWSHVCVIASDGNAYCWGDDHDGQLGNDSEHSNSLVPVQVSLLAVHSSATVLVGGLPCTDVKVLSSTKITCVTPAHPAGLVDVELTLEDRGSITLPSSYLYVGEDGGDTDGDGDIETPSTGFFSSISDGVAGSVIFSAVAGAGVSLVFYITRKLHRYKR
jgi:alpha-tubulin suppressor-like RCC1 family protein